MQKIRKGSPFAPKVEEKGPTIIEGKNNIFVDVEQNSDEWFDLRMKKITSSKIACIMAHLGKAFGEPAIKYAQKIALEVVTGKRDETESYSNKYMEMGHENEPEAIRLYERDTGNKVTNGGFYYERSDDLILVGDSPDGNVGSDGCVEVKSVTPTTHWERIKKGGFDTKYKWQIHNHIWIGDKQWCDFVSYCPGFPEHKQLYVYRVERDEEIIEKMKERVNEFKKVVEDHINILNGR